MEEQKNFKKIAARLDNSMPEGVTISNPMREKFAKAMQKKANISYDDAYNMTRVPLYFQDPLWDSQESFFDSYSLEEQNRRYRHWDKTHPIFSSCVDIHSTFPITDFELQVEDEEVKEYYNYLAHDRYDLINMSTFSLHDRTLLGESFFIGNWDEENQEWKEWVQYPPEYIEITNVPGTSERVFTIKPDPEIKRIQETSSEATQILNDILEHTNNKYYQTAMAGENFNIPETRLIYISNKTSSYAKRGTPIARRAVADLLYEAQIRTLQHTFVQRHLFPIKVFKLGSKELGWIPSKKHFENFKKLLVQAAADPDFNLIYHFGLEVEYIGTKDKIENLIPHFEFVSKRIMNAFFVNDTLINGETPGYAGQTANIKMLMHRFNTCREELQREYRNKMFFPIAKRQGFIRQTDGEIKKAVKVKSKSFAYKKYILPEFMWRRQNLLNNTQEQQFLLNLYNSDDIPFSVIADVFGLDRNILKQYRKYDQGTYSNKITREIIDQTVKEDPSLSLKYISGEDPIEIMRNKLKQDQILQEQEKMDKENRENGDMLGAPSDMSSEMPSSFDSSAPLDLGSETVTEENTEETTEAPIEEGPTEGEGGETLPTPPGGETPIE